jgi:lysophospholipase L1-like esterase
MREFFFFLLLLVLSSVSQASDFLTVHMAGDSTMSIKDPKDYPETGWGVPFATFFNERVRVVNYAQNGRSTRTFIEEGRWHNLISSVRAGDYVIIQFGHNDESEKKVDRYTTPEQFKKNLNRFIQDVQKKNATPILLTSIVRRHFNKNGRLTHTHPYSTLVRELVAELSGMPNLQFIDMEKITWAHFENMGNRDSSLRFMHIPANTHPNYPNGVRDDTHLNAFGAREVAQLFLRALTQQQHPLAAMTRAVDPKHLKLRY